MTTRVLQHPLDILGTYRMLDPSGIRDRLSGFAAQCRGAIAQVQSLHLPSSYRDADSVVVAGMGGSAIGGELAMDLLGHLDIRLPVTVWRDYGIPPWVNERTLVVACSYSGTTEETLSAFDAARERGARLVVITSGGLLAQRAQWSSAPLVEVGFLSEPRNALGFMFVSVLGILNSVRLIPDLAAQVKEAATRLEQMAWRFAPQRPTSLNPAKSLAQQLHERVPIVYGAGFLTGAARRWKTDFNENSKCWAVAEALPELHHNSVVGYALPRRLRRDAHVLLLSSRLLPEPLRRRIAATTELLQRSGVEYTVLEGEGDTGLSQLLDLVYLGSWTSYYLALLYGVDPAPVEPIQFLKDRLKSLVHEIGSAAVWQQAES